MRYVIIGLVIIVALIGALMIYVRTARIDPEVWHNFPEEADPRVPDYSTSNSRLSHRSYAAAPAEVLAKLDAIARATPWTGVLAGDVTEGMISYVTRSALWGFPDVTTAIAREDDKGGTNLIVHGRAVIGHHDWGVNSKRVSGWIEALRWDQ